MMDGLKLFILTVVLFLYLLLGAVVFHFLESTNENETRYSLRDIRQSLLSNHSCLTVEALEDFVHAVVAAREAGITIQGNQSSPSNWDFSSSFFFSGTVVTTIGYGNISPSTRGGQGFTVFYALIGIPLCGVVLAKLGTKINAKLKSHWARLKGVLEQQDMPGWLVQVVRITLGVIILLGIFILIPAGAFTAIEGWSFHESFYYCFVTLTTIGFGDFVIGTNSDINYTWVYKWVAYVWIFLGLVVMATVIGIIGEQLEERAEQSSIGRKKNKSEKENRVESEEERYTRTSQDKLNTNGEKAGEMELNAKNGNEECVV